MSNSNDRAANLLRIASYLGRPQKFIAVGNVRAKMRRPLALAAKGRVVLTTHGKPEAAVLRFTIVEDMRRVLVHSLVTKMDASFKRSRERPRPQRKDVPASSEKELEALVGEALKKARRRNGRSYRKQTGA